jgi:hypothetical protein
LTLNNEHWNFELGTECVEINVHERPVERGAWGQRNA